MPNLSRRVSTVLAAVFAALALSVVVAPVASAEPNPAPPTLKDECGFWTVTCTDYWSVERTKELNEENKSILLGTYGIASYAIGMVPTPPTRVMGGVLLAAGMQFDSQLSGAANDGRCLIFKYPAGERGAGWYGSVAPSKYDENGHRTKKGNEKCDKAVQQDSSRGLFGVFK